MTTTVKTVRLPTELAARVEAESANVGLTFNDYAVYALERLLSGSNEPDACFLFLRQLAQWTRETYRGKSFPTTVTLEVFHHIRDTEDLRKAYDRLLANDVDRQAIRSLHRRIGLMVKRVLKAKVEGRSAPRNPQRDLVTTFSYLVPATPGEEEA